MLDSPFLRTTAFGLVLYLCLMIKKTIITHLQMKRLITRAERLALRIKQLSEEIEKLKGKI